MNTLIVYYSLEGNTAFAAQKIASSIGADLLKLEPVKSYPTGKISKFFWGGKSAVMAEKPELQKYDFRADAYERIIFGFPVWASQFAPPLRTFIQDNDLKGKHFAAFACQSGNGADKAFVKLKAALGVDALDAELILIDPKMHPVPENDGNLKAFCEKLQ